MNIVDLMISLSALAVAGYAVVTSRASERRNRARRECLDLIEQATAADAGVHLRLVASGTGTEQAPTTPRPTLYCLPGGAQ